MSNLNRNQGYSFDEVQWICCLQVVLFLLLIGIVNSFIWSFDWFGLLNFRSSTHFWEMGLQSTTETVLFLRRVHFSIIKIPNVTRISPCLVQFEIANWRKKERNFFRVVGGLTDETVAVLFLRGEIPDGVNWYPSQSTSVLRSGILLGRC